MNPETPPPLDTVRYEVQGNVAVITLHRPDRMNTLGGSMKPDLGRAFLDYARADERVRAVLVTGSGDRAFCAGADIKERAGSQAIGTDYFVAQKATHDLFRDIEEFEKPVIAAINGVALGGGLELALCADIRLAGEPEAGNGRIFDRHRRVVGIADAIEAIDRRAGAQPELERLIRRDRARRPHEPFAAHRPSARRHVFREGREFGELLLDAAGDEGACALTAH